MAHGIWGPNHHELGSITLEWWEGGAKRGPNLTLCLSLRPENTKNTELELRDYFVIHLSIQLPST